MCRLFGSELRDLFRIIMIRSKMYIPKLQVYTLDYDFIISSAYLRG